MKFANAQEVYDHVKAALIKQGKPSIYKTTCMYRGPNETKCAAGHCIDDEDYDPKMEGRTIDIIMERFEKISYLSPYEKLLRDLQYCHDYCREFNWSQEWKMRMMGVAMIHNLNAGEF